MQSTLLTKEKEDRWWVKESLKKIRFDPLFSLNHTCAMLRANLNRLFRRTWCTTKKPERLALHIAMYVVFHNETLLNK